MLSSHYNVNCIMDAEKYMCWILYEGDKARKMQKKLALLQNMNILRYLYTKWRKRPIECPNKESVKQKVYVKKEKDYKRESDFLKAMCINLLIYIALLIFLKPVFKSDDMYMSSIVYGLHTGKYDCHILYSNVIVGKCIVGLLKVFPKVPWMFVLQVACCFLAMTIIYQRTLGGFEGRNFFKVVVVTVMQYETMIQITFTKTATLTYLCASLLLISALENKSIRESVCGLIWMSIGILVRPGVYPLCIVFFSIYLGIIMCDAYEKRRKKTIPFITVYLCAIFIISIIILKGSAWYDAREYKNDEIWSSYYEMNSKKIQFTDYEGEGYIEKKNEYDKIGCSQNDLEMLKTNNLHYKTLWQSEWIDNVLDVYNVKIRSTEDIIHSAFDMDNMSRYLKRFFVSYLNEPLYVLLTIWIIFELCQQKKKFLDIISLYATTMVLEYYLYLQGRSFQKHVDFALIIFGGILALKRIEKNYEDKQKSSKQYVKQVMIYGMVVTLFLNAQYVYIKNGVFENYNSSLSCQGKYSKELLEPLATDKEHIYLCSSDETVFSMWSYEAYEIPKVGGYDNILALSEYMWGNGYTIAEREKIDNPLEELVGSDRLRFFVSDENEVGEVKMFETYCKEHVNPKSKFVKIAENQTINIYKCVVE